MNHTGHRKTLNFTERVAREISLLLLLKKKRRTDLAEHLGVSPQTITRRLSGAVPINLEDINSIAEWLDVPIGRIIDPDYDITKDMQ